MLTTLAISNYRSLLNVVVPLGPLNVVTGPNGSGKSNLYRSLRLLAETAQGGVINALAREGGLPSTFWAGPETLSKQMKTGSAPIQGGPRSMPVRMRLGFADSEFGYAISLGLPPPPDPENSEPTKFLLDPEIKNESIWAGEAYRPASLLSVKLFQHGLLRPLSGAELSDGTLRYLLWVAALLTPRPPPLMVLNEPETSLHPDLLPALARLIIRASESTQVWVVSHSTRLIAALEKHSECATIQLEKVFSETKIVDQGLLDTPIWRWPGKG